MHATGLSTSSQPFVMEVFWRNVLWADGIAHIAMLREGCRHPRARMPPHAPKMCKSLAAWQAVCTTAAMLYRIQQKAEVKSHLGQIGGR
jgi:hypothetical protein